MTRCSWSYGVRTGSVGAVSATSGSSGGLCIGAPGRVDAGQNNKPRLLVSLPKPRFKMKMAPPERGLHITRGGFILPAFCLRLGHLGATCRRRRHPSSDPKDLWTIPWSFRGGGGGSFSWRKHRQEEKTAPPLGRYGGAGQSRRRKSWGYGATKTLHIAGRDWDHDGSEKGAHGPGMRGLPIESPTRRNRSAGSFNL